MNNVKSNLITTLMAIIAFNTTFMIIAVKNISLLVSVLAFIFSLASIYFLTMDSTNQANNNIKVLDSLGAKQTYILSSMLPFITITTIIGIFLGSVLGFLIAYLSINTVFEFELIISNTFFYSLIPVLLGAIIGNIVGVTISWRK